MCPSNSELYYIYHKNLQANPSSFVVLHQPLMRAYSPNHVFIKDQPAHVYKRASICKKAEIE